MTDPCDKGLRAADLWLADCITRRTTVAVVPGPAGTCAVCGRAIPPARLATGAGTCIDCQIKIEEGRLA